jgi:hypothetical protein
MATPTIGTPSGSWSHGYSVVIPGTNFGTKIGGQAPVVWDNCSHGQALSARWNTCYPNLGTAGYQIGYRSAQRGIALPHNRITKYICGCHGDGWSPNGAAGGANVFFSKNRTQSFPCYSYWSFYRRYDDNWQFQYPGIGDGTNDNNLKVFGLSTGSDGIYGGMPNNYYVAYNTPYPDQATDTGAQCQLAMWDDAAPTGIPVTGSDRWFDYCTNPFAGAWIKTEYEIRYTNQTSGYFRMWENGVSRWNFSGKTDGYSGTSRAEGIGGYARQYGLGATQWRYWSDIYLDYTPQRVMLGNAATYGGSTTRREVQIVSAWSSTSITVTVNLGGFGDTGTAYLYVVNELGEVSAGQAVTLGGGGSSPPVGTPVLSVR